MLLRSRPRRVGRSVVLEVPAVTCLPRRRSRCNVSFRQELTLSSSNPSDCNQSGTDIAVNGKRQFIGGAVPVSRSREGRKQRLRRYLRTSQSFRRERPSANKSARVGLFVN
jgi:hypothetical protein